MTKRLTAFQAITALSNVSRAATSSLDLREVVKETLRALAEGLGIERGMLVLKDPGSEEAVIEAAHNMSEEEIKRGRYRAGEGVVGRVLATGEPMIVPNVGKEPLFLDRTKSRGDIKKSQISFICVPVKLDNETVGALSVDLSFDEDISFEEDERILAVAAGYIAQAVRIQRMVESEKSLLADENLHLRRALEGEYKLKNLVGNSQAMKSVFEQIALVAKSRATVLITGESGTGKELVAKALHFNSERHDKPFVGLSCASLPESVLENELFGHEKGAFTGALTLKRGRFELAHGGTIFLDEIGEIPLNLQVKLLRVLQEREFERLGGKDTVKIDVRVIAATNRDLTAEVRAGRFREDLFYRLNVVPIHMPPLRERKGDIPLLAHSFLEKFRLENERKVKGFSRAALTAMTNYDWPGNVRELENAIERAVVLSQGDTLMPGDLPMGLGGERRSSLELPGEEMNLTDMLDDLERQIIVRTLENAGGSQTKAAKALGIARTTLRYKMEKHGLVGVDD
jgi:Nif-specific regulatory protein